MINSPPAANSKPFITVNTHAYASVNTGTYKNRCRLQHGQTHTHRHYNTDIWLAYSSTQTSSRYKERRPQRCTGTWANTKVNAYTHSHTYIHTTPKSWLLQLLNIPPLSQSAFGGPSPPTVSPLSWNKY